MSKKASPSQPVAGVDSVAAAVSGDGRTASPDLISGGQAVAKSLISAGVSHAFCVPGESFMGVLEAMHASPSMRVITTRHEAGAAFMAVGYAAQTKRPAVCMGTRMVGAANLSIGIHTAFQDSVPLVAILGQTPTHFRYREAFQEVDLDMVFTPLTKSAIEVPAADRLAELTLRAARIAISGRPGPVALVLREELSQATVADVPIPDAIARPVPAPDPEAVEQALDVLRGASRPIILIGGGVLMAGATDECVRFAETEAIPVVTAWRRPDAFPNSHPLYLGWAGLRSPGTVLDRLLEADVVVVVGSRLSEFTTYRYQAPTASTRLIHADVSAEVLGGHRTADIPVQSDAKLFFLALLDAAARRQPDANLLAERQRRNRQDRAAWEKETSPGRGVGRPGYVDQQTVAAHLRRLLPRDAITVTDGGNFAGWPARFLRWERPGSFLGPTSGAMGYGIPAAIGAKLAQPDRPVVAFVGDGGFMMTGMEIETAVREETPIVVLVYDNQQYGTIKMHQVHDYPSQLVGTNLGPIDFGGLAQALGADGLRVNTDAEFPNAFAEALENGRPTVLHLNVDPQQLFVGDDP